MHNITDMLSTKSKLPSLMPNKTFSVTMFPTFMVCGSCQ